MLHLAIWVNRIFVKTQGRCWSLGLGGTYFKSKSLLRSQQLKSNGDVGVPIRLGSRRRSKEEDKEGNFNTAVAKARRLPMNTATSHAVVWAVTEYSALRERVEPEWVGKSPLGYDFVNLTCVQFDCYVWDLHRWGRVHVPSIELQ